LFALQIALKCASEIISANSGQKKRMGGGFKGGGDRCFMISYLWVIGAAAPASASASALGCVCHSLSK